MLRDLLPGFTENRDGDERQMGASGHVGHAPAGLRDGLDGKGVREDRLEEGEIRTLWRVQCIRQKLTSIREVAMLMIVAPNKVQSDDHYTNQSCGKHNCNDVPKSQAFLELLAAVLRSDVLLAQLNHID